MCDAKFNSQIPQATNLKGKFPFNVSLYIKYDLSTPPRNDERKVQTTIETKSKNIKEIYQGLWA